MQQLTIEVKILIFKTLAISKFVYFAIVRDAPSSTIAQLEKYKHNSFEKKKILNWNILLYVTSMNKDD